MDSFGEILIYQTEDGLTKLDVRMEDETVWLTQQQMAELFQTSRTNVVDHIKNIYEEGELDENSTCRKFRQVRMEGSRQVTRELPFYNSCILPEGWTVDTLMESHESKPYNPDIARVFYRAGFIENWGQGIQKICDECKGIGAELPIYELTGTTLRIRFKALESALIDQPKVPKDQLDTLGDTLADSIITLIKGNPQITQSELADVTKVSVPSIKRTMKILSDNGRIVRKGGKRYGYWEVN